MAQSECDLCRRCPGQLYSLTAVVHSRSSNWKVEQYRCIALSCSDALALDLEI